MQENNTKEMKEMTKHYDKVMEDRMAEQKRLLEEGFQKEANQLKEEIKNLKTPRRSKRGGCIIM